MLVKVQKRTRRGETKSHEARPEVCLNLDEDGRIVCVEPAASAAFGWPQEDLVGRPLSHFLSCSPHERLSDALSHALCGHETENLPLRFKQKNGIDRLWLSRIWQGRSRQVFVLAQDFGPSQIQDFQPERFLEEAGDILVVSGGDGRWFQVNDACTRLLGWSYAELTAAPFMDFVHPLDLDRTRMMAAGVVRGEDVVEFENRFRCKDGSLIWLSWRARKDKASGLVYSSAVDITSRKKAEAELRHIFDVASDILIVSNADGPFTCPIVLDGTGWHQTGGQLRIPDNISLLHLPPYSLELNPQENVWQHLRQNYLANRVYENYEAIVDACCQAWTALMAQPDQIRSIGIRDCAEVII